MFAVGNRAAILHHLDQAAIIPHVAESEGRKCPFEVRDNFSAPPPGNLPDTGTALIGQKACRQLGIVASNKSQLCKNFAGSNPLNSHAKP